MLGGMLVGMLVDMLSGMLVGMLGGDRRRKSAERQHQMYYTGCFHFLINFIY
jgi:LDH2 family malate/lactate/ureidoglycolate dehydrogenase